MKIYLNELGVVSALGKGCEETICAVLQNESSPLHRTDEFSPGKQRHVGQIQSELSAIKGDLAEKVGYQSRNNQVLMTAFEQIESAVDIVVQEVGVSRVAVILGTSTSGISEGEQAYKSYQLHGKWPEGYHYQQQDIGCPAMFLAEHLGLKGIAYTISTACSSGAKALASAARLLDLGLCDAVIAGGVDSLCKLTVQGFGALDALSEEICNPSSRRRSGINVGEAAAVFLVSGNPSRVCLSGTGESSDAHHISAPDPEGKGAFAAMSEALRQAGKTQKDIDYLNLHGTATVQNDQMEHRAINQLFGSTVLCSSTKPLTGHCLGAAGAIEAGLCWLILQAEHFDVQSSVPVHRWDGEEDERLAKLELVDINNCNPERLQTVMSNSFAFGGSNISLIMERD